MKAGLTYPEKNKKSDVPFTAAHNGSGKHLVLYQIAEFAADDTTERAVSV